MSKATKKIGIMGGTFDPIHMGHLILGEKAYEQLELDKVLFMPCGNPPHKRNRKGRATDEQRAEMEYERCKAEYEEEKVKLVELYDIQKQAKETLHFSQRLLHMYFRC